MGSKELQNSAERDLQLKNKVRVVVAFYSLALGFVVGYLFEENQELQIKIFFIGTLVLLLIVLKLHRAHKK